jgi:hypothetical protein
MGKRNNGTISSLSIFPLQWIQRTTSRRISQMHTSSVRFSQSPTFPSCFCICFLSARRICQFILMFVLDITLRVNLLYPSAGTNVLV